MPDALLKLLVKDKLLHSRKVPVNAKEWQLKPPEKNKHLSANQRERLAVETPEGKQDHSG